MTNREYYLRRSILEAPILAKVFKAVPEGKLDYRPHPRSRSAAELLSLMAYELKTSSEAIETGKINWNEPPPAKSVNQIVEELNKAQEELERRLKKLDDQTWENKKVQLLAGGQVAFEETLGEMLWTTHYDLIHHRGQLSTYIRPMGGKVPSIYGPSADDMGM
ncbi:MAG: hypothetical protein A2Z27_01370 [candidate division Zixibacteria bacterium RBG_16_50_21]|nr:MAG: hypothetical protein A2Z27_01370 [candidate division Zixibacteria bacterium RBG_16_50_21]